MTLKFSVERLVESEKETEDVDVDEQHQNDLKKTPFGVLKVEDVEEDVEEEEEEEEEEKSTKEEPLAQTLSYFDVLLPHVQMACSNPFISGIGASSAAGSSENSAVPGGGGGTVWQHPWLELLQSTTAAQFGDVTAGLFLQPLRKNKRIRTAFSASQLIQLEKAFEGNHYVVGNERKQLATRLSLTETQVKVWFQNRRTKHKRVRMEGSDANGSPSPSNDEDEEEDKKSTTS